MPRLTLTLAFAVVLAACTSDVPVEDYVFACTTPVECGPGFTCVESRCIPEGRATDVIAESDTPVVDSDVGPQHPPLQARTLFPVIARGVSKGGDYVLTPAGGVPIVRGTSSGGDLILRATTPMNANK